MGRRTRFLIGLIVASVVMALAPTAVAGAVPLPPTLVGPLNSDTVGSNPVFQWSSSAGAVTYRVQISTTADFANPTYDRYTVNLYATPESDLPQGTLYWRVFALDAQNQPSLPSSTFTLSKIPGAAPTPTSPASGATLDFPVTPLTFSWDAQVGSRSYDIEIATEPLFIPPVLHQGNTVNTSYTLSSPQAIGQTFYWHVRGKSGSDLPTQWSSVQQYTLSWTQGPPTLTCPPDAFNPAIEPIDFQWDPVPGAKNYDIQVSPDIDFSGSLEINTTVLSTVYSPPVTLLNASYFWRVRSRNAGDGLSAWSQVRKFTKAWPGSVPACSKSGPQGSFPAVTLLTPANGATGVQQTDFSWTPQRLATQYELQIAQDSNFSSNVTSCVTAHTTYTPYPGCDTVAGTTYYWRVRGIDQPRGVLGIWSTPFTFTRGVYAPSGTTVPFETTTQTGPANCATGPCADNFVTPTFTWLPVDQASSYQVTMAADINFTNIVKTYQTSYTTLTPVEAYDDFQAGQSWYWYARPCFSVPVQHCGPAADTFVNANPSPVWTFRKQSRGVQLSTPLTDEVVAHQVTFNWTDFLTTNQNATDLLGDPKTTEEARQYRVQVFTTADTSSMIDESGPIDATEYTSPNKSYPEGPLWWRVQAIDADNHQLTFSPLRRLVKSSPVPTLQSPAPNAMVQGTPPFRWAPLPYSYRYEIEVYKNTTQPLSSGNRVLGATTDTTSWAPNQQLPNGLYGWRIRRIDPGNNYGAWTATTNSQLSLFTVTANAVTLVSPADGAGPQNPLLFNWTTLPGAAVYRLESSTTPLFSNFFETQNTVMNSWAPSGAYPSATPYYWRVKAFDASNNFLSSSSTFTFGPTVPGPPTNVVATPQNSAAGLTWTAPASTGGAPITGYTITASPGGATKTVGNTTSTTFTGLTNGTTYTFTVHATNIVGNSPESTSSNPVTPRSIADAPTNVVATAGNASADMTWTVPASDGGSPITGYTITAQPGFLTQTVGNVTATTFTGLTNGTAYTFTVAAINGAGTGPDSAPSNTVTPRTIPGAPTGVSAVPGNASAVVSWTSPPSDGGATITAYTITASPGGATLTVGNVVSTTFTGLTNGTAYTFTVHATNVAGDGPESSPSSAVTPRTTPGAPSGVAGTPGNGSAALIWTAPASNGGSPITGYRITTSPGGATLTVGNVLNANVTGLTNGSAYTFTVAAINVVGTGPESAASNTVTPRTTPDAPTGVTATAGNGSANVAWTPPAVNGGAAITGYTITASPGGATLTVGNITSTTFGGLANGTAYTFTVAAINAAGTGAASAASNSVTPFGLPGQPTNVTGTAGNTYVSLAWSSPASNGGSAVTGYRITASPGGATKTVGNVSTTTFTGLTNGTAYTFTVAAINAAGTGPDSAPSASITPITLGAQFHAMVPTRFLDSRNSTGGWNAPLAAGSPRGLAVAGQHGIPNSASAVVMNVAVTGATAGSFLVAYPAGVTQPTAANLNFGPGQTIPNLVTVKIGTGGQVMFANAVGSTNVIADVVGYFDDGTQLDGDFFNGVTPTRLLDSRTPTGNWNSPLSAGAPKTLNVRGVSPVPATATAVVANVTVTGATAGSFLTAYPSGVAAPTAANLNFGPGQTVPNLVTVKIGADGKVAFLNAVGSVNVIVDVVGYFDPTGGSRFHAITPERLLDSRNGTGLNGKWSANQSRALLVSPNGQVAAGATGIVTNVAVTGGTASSFVTVYPDLEGVPPTANLLFGPGQTVPNLVMAKIGTNGKIGFFNQQGSVHIIADAVGFYAPT